MRGNKLKNEIKLRYTKKRKKFIRTNWSNFRPE